MIKKIFGFKGLSLLFLSFVALVTFMFPNHAAASVTSEMVALSNSEISNPLHAEEGTLIPIEFLDFDVTTDMNNRSGNSGVSGPFYETGAFVPNQTLPIYSSPRNSQPISGLTYAKGEVIYYDSYYVTCEADHCSYGRVFISYISNSGQRRYVPIRPHSYKVYGATWGYFLY